MNKKDKILSYILEEDILRLKILNKENILIVNTYLNPSHPLYYKKSLPKKVKPLKSFSSIKSNLIQDFIDSLIGLPFKK